MIKKRISWIALAGVILILAGLIGIYSGPEISQYAFLPSAADYRAAMTKAEEKWQDTFPSISLHGVAEQISLTAESGRSQGEITLHEIMSGYGEIYPRAYAAGRALSRGDEKKTVIVLDDRLAFRLFGDEDPLGTEVTLGEKKYQVVGVASSPSRIGDTGSYTAWIPYGADGAPAPKVMVFSAGGRTGSSQRTIFASGAKEIFGEGQAIFLGKERTRGTVMLRIVLTVLAIWLLARWIRWMSGLFRRWIAELRGKLETRYPHQMAGTLLGRGAEMLLLTVMTIAACAGLVVWNSRLMLIFPEWVPEILVDPSSIAQRFRELTSAAASPVQFRTPELAEIRFWAGCIRWGVMLFLLGGFMKACGKSGKGKE